ncbi:guanine nucleotide binding protein, alpha subunit [Globomyces pollinis-pini]|nr:guanine nucleotide binding protein, alpha subunit [Globomyces pollinis-pini]
MGLCISKKVDNTPVRNVKALKPAIRSKERDQIEYDKILEEERLKSKARKLEEYLKEEKAKYDAEQQEPRVLILGSSDSGKSTFLKQLKILHGNGFSMEELEKAKRSVVFNLFAICRKIVTESPSEKIQSYFNIEQLTIEEAKESIPVDITTTMVTMWHDPNIKEIYKTFGDMFPLSSIYFFDKLEQVLNSNYVMSQEDILLMRSVTQHISDNVFEIPVNSNKLKLHFYDVSGLKYHRKHWVAYFENIQLIVFLVAISSYDQVLSEDKDVNRMVDAIKLFGDIVNHPLLTQPDMVVFFNKKDLFDIKIQTIPLKNYFPNYNGKEFDSPDAIKFFKQCLISKLKHEDKLVTFHSTCCTDTKMMSKIIPSVLHSVMKGQMNSFGV